MSKRWTEQDLQRLQKEKGFTIVDTNRKRNAPELSNFSLDAPKRGRPNISNPEVVAGLLKKNKFGAKKVIIDGIKFDSTKEGNRYLDLKFMEKAGDISCLRLQKKYEFIHNYQKIGSYRADFVYFDKNNKLIVEDVKSPITRKKTDYRLRKKMMKIFFGIEILET